MNQPAPRPQAVGKTRASKVRLPDATPSSAVAGAIREATVTAGSETATPAKSPAPLGDAELLDAAQRAIDAYRLTLPPGDNAYEYLQAVLAEDPDNATAQSGLQQIATAYQQLASKKIEVDDLEAADRLAKRGLKVNPGDPGLLAIAEAIGALKALNLTKRHETAAWSRSM